MGAGYVIQGWCLTNLYLWQNRMEFHMVFLILWYNVRVPNY